MHIGLCVYPDRESSLTQAFKRVTNNYLELSLSEKNLQRKAIQLAEIYKPDFVFLQLQADNVLQLETVREIKKHSGFVVNWTGDVRRPLQPFFLQMSKIIDCTCFTNEEDVHYIRNHGARSEFVQIGYDEKIYYPGKVIKDIDIVFMGNNYGNQFPLGKVRIQMINYLRATYGSKFRVFGNIQSADGNVNHSQHDEAAIYRRSKLAINLSHFNIQRYTSDRMLRILGCGVPCLTHNFEGLEKDFKPDENVIVWTTINELKSKIDLLLSDYGKAKQIGAAGNRLAVNNFTFNHMVQNLLNLAK